jgi:hypothetical protein
MSQKVSFSYEIFISPPILPSGTACSCYAPEDIHFAATLSTGDDSGTSVTL